MIYDSPHYIPLLNKSISALNINIKCDFGNAVEFIKGNVLIKLHFKSL